MIQTLVQYTNSRLAKFDEGQHPRASDGKFMGGSSEASGKGSEAGKAEGFSIQPGEYRRLLGGKPYTLKYAVAYKGKGFSYFFTEKAAKEYIQSGKAHAAVGALRSLGFGRQFKGKK